MSGDDFEIELKLPERVPPGEHILWQGAPETVSLARRAFHLTLVASYFAILAGWSLASGLSDGLAATAIMGSLSRIAIVAVAALGAVLLLAWLSKRSSTYMVTTERVVMRFGVALPMTINVPFRYIAAADLKPYSDGTGDIALRLDGDRFLGFVPLWPHVRAWRLAKPEPVLRSVAGAHAVAATLAAALAESQAHRQGAHAIAGAGSLAGAVSARQPALNSRNDPSPPAVTGQTAAA